MATGKEWDEILRDMSEETLKDMKNHLLGLRNPEYQINGGDSKVLVDQDTGRIELAKHIKIPDLFFPSQWLMNKGGERTKEMRYTPKYVDKIMKEYGKMVRECWNIAHALKAHIVGAG